MQYSCLIQTNDDLSRSVRSFLESHIDGEDYRYVYAAMAYVTVAGLRDVLDLLKEPPANTRWVIGLDDAVTQPGAIELCQSLPQSQVRVASLEQEQRRFHPKMLYLSNGANSSQAFMMLGSSNLTKAALCGNAESVIILQADTPVDRAALDALRQTAWKRGHGPSPSELESYSQKYKHSKKHRSRAMKARTKPPPPASKYPVKLVLNDDHAEIDPSTATTCWIECGNVTAMGRELEFKAEQGLFFGLNPHGEAPKNLKYIVSDGTTIQLRMKYQGNHMWRLQMTRGVPEVAKGLRPIGPSGKLGRSPWVAVFKRVGQQDTYALTFVKLNSKDHKKLRLCSIDTGTRGYTTAREYGWF